MRWLAVVPGQLGEVIGGGGGEARCRGQRQWPSLVAAGGR